MQICVDCRNSSDDIHQCRGCGKLTCVRCYLYSAEDRCYYCAKWPNSKVDTNSSLDYLKRSSPRLLPSIVLQELSPSASSRRTAGREGGRCLEYTNTSEALSSNDLPESQGLPQKLALVEKQGEADLLYRCVTTLPATESPDRSSVMLSNDLQANVCHAGEGSATTEHKSQCKLGKEKKADRKKSSNEKKTEKKENKKWCGPCQAYIDGNLVEHMRKVHQTSQASAAAAGRFYKSCQAAAAAEERHKVTENDTTEEKTTWQCVICHLKRKDIRDHFIRKHPDLISQGKTEGIKYPLLHDYLVKCKEVREEKKVEKWFVCPINMLPECGVQSEAIVRKISTDLSRSHLKKKQITDV